MCKSMFRTWRSLGRHYINDSRVLIAEMDCEDGNNENICETYEVELYPTYILFHNGENVREYVAMKTKRQLYKYVEKYIKRNVEFDDQLVDLQGEF